jgi:predicted kinase
MKPMLLLMVGYPGSGKSSWARRQGFPIVNTDSIRRALHGKWWDAEREPEVWKIAHVMVEALFLAGHSTVILDACNLTPGMRAQWVSPERWNTYAKLILTPKQKCRTYIKKRGINVSAVLKFINRIQYIPIYRTERIKLYDRD